MRRGLLPLLALIAVVSLATQSGRPAATANPLPQQKELLARIEALEG
jgi:hypothetical protein